jgi:hypothetical protein
MRFTLRKLPGAQPSRPWGDQRVAWSSPVIRQARRLPAPQAKMPAPQGELFAHYRHHNFPAVRSAPVLEKEDTLPRA